MRSFAAIVIGYCILRQKISLVRSLQKSCHFAASEATVDLIEYLLVLAPGVLSLFIAIFRDTIKGE
jgi:hypothetical protein